ncbi:MAG: type II toxin-antitoxin system VapC family toxin [Rhizomicrobium sp.]
MTQPLLLDTCTCLWVMADELAQNAEQALTDAFHGGRAVFVSPITALEIAIMARKRRLRSPLDPHRWFATLVGQPGIALASMPSEVLIASQQLPDFPNNDPYDRIIAATAREYGFTVMTRDAALLDYGAQGYLSVFAC